MNVAVVVAGDRHRNQPGGFGIETGDPRQSEGPLVDQRVTDPGKQGFAARRRYDGLIDLAEHGIEPRDPLHLPGSLLYQRNVPNNFRRAGNPAAVVPDRRYGKRDVDQPALFRLSHRFQGIDALATPQLVPNDLFFVLPALWDHSDNRSPDNFVGAIAENISCACVPAGDCAVQILTNNRVKGRIDDSGEKLAGSLDPADLAKDAQQRAVG
ncbi:MAG: hypothetical protein ABR948_19945 [Bradyrhizobium sp.]